jgi:hypothetical protein
MGFSTRPLGPCTLPFSGHTPDRDFLAAPSSSASSNIRHCTACSPAALQVHLSLPLVTLATYLQPSSSSSATALPVALLLSRSICLSHCSRFSCCSLLSSFLQHPPLHCLQPCCSPGSSVSPTGHTRHLSPGFFLFSSATALPAALLLSRPIYPTRWSHSPILSSLLPALHFPNMGLSTATFLYSSPYSYWLSSGSYPAIFPRAAHWACLAYFRP